MLTLPNADPSRAYRLCLRGEASTSFGPDYCVRLAAADLPLKQFLGPVLLGMLAALLRLPLPLMSLACTSQSATFMPHSALV